MATSVLGEMKPIGLKPRGQNPIAGDQTSDIPAAAKRHERFRKRAQPPRIGMSDDEPDRTAGRGRQSVQDTIGRAEARNIGHEPERRRESLRYIRAAPRPPAMAGDVARLEPRRDVC
jgi:hypothetical protein